jgi:uncharacterized protein YggE
MAFLEGAEGAPIRRAVSVVLWMLVAFLAVAVISGLQAMRYIGAGLQATNTISVSGHGEILAKPDIAEFDFSVVSDKATVADAQTDATAKINTITNYLTGQGISKDDIQTSDYSVYPQYDYQSVVCPQTSGVPVYCPSDRQVLKGYEVRQSTTVKVHDTTKAGDLLAGVGTKGATEVSSLQFTFNDPQAPQNDARNKAIADAKQKADTLAKSLGVSLVRVVSFTENAGGNYPRPLTYALGGAQASNSKTVAPEISTGQNKVSDDVTITYEIR